MNLSNIRRLVFPLAILLVGFASCSNAWGWLSTGHRIVAMIAWEDLTPNTRAKVTAILKLHPRYTQDLLSYMPAGTPDDAVPRYAFASAATWPDIVKSLNNPMHAAYSHPDWHYIDIPFAIGGQAVPNPTTEPTNTKNIGPHNAVEALTANVAQIKDPQTSGMKQAIALCWVLHLCGDIHQPLHACSLYSPQFPNGDQGGNLMIVLRDPPYPDSQAKLHLVWDSLPGDFLARNFEDYITEGLRKDPAYARDQYKDLLGVTDFAAWAQESHDLAVKYAYLDGQLKGATAPSKAAEARALGNRNNPIPGLPPGYVRTAEGIASKQLALAGYRLADLLNSIYDKP